MSFANPLLLFGLLGVLIPIIIHLITQHRAKRVDWGAMLFLTESVVHRSRRTLLEQILLLMARCLLVGLVAMALALPFVRPDSRIPWPFVLSTALLGTAALGAATAVAIYRLWRWGLIVAGVLLIGLAGFSQWLGMVSILKPAGAVDVVIVIDGSDSMNLAVDGATNFQTAVKEATTIIHALRPGDAASIVLAGAQVQSKPTAPSRRPEELRKIVAELSLVGGTMSARDALAAAAGICSRGDNASKKIVIITDGHSAGWTADGHVNWQQIAEPLKQLSVPPAIVLRRLPMPKRINNVQLADIKAAEGIMGPDREQAIQVRVENTGTVAVTDPFDVELSVNNAPHTLRLPIARLEPGVAQSLTFHIRPTRGGLHNVVARIARADDMPWDNSFARVIRAFERIPILLVDGNPTGRVRDRATWFLDLALSPEIEESVKAASPKGAAAADKAPAGGLYRVTTVDLSKISTVGDLRQYRVVVLADVPKLPITTAVGVADFVADGGGLLVSLGSRCQKSFYNNWQVRGGPLMPGPLTERRVSDSAQPAVHPQISSFAHPALRVVGENPQTDIGNATITSYWQLKPTPGDGGGLMWAALSSGDPWIMERRVGRGRIVVSSVALDRSGSDLPALQSFLPLVNEVVGHLIQLPTGGTEIAFGAKHSLELRTMDAGRARAAWQAETSPAGSSATKQQGLQGEYFAGADFRNRLLSRVDPSIAFQWPASPIVQLTDPAFSVRWTGTLIPPANDAYTFSLEGEQTRLWINGKMIVATAPPPSPPASGVAPPAAAPAPQPAVSQPVEMSGGKPYAIRVEHVGKSGQGKCELFWQGKLLPRQTIPTTSLTPGVAWRTELASSAKHDAPASLAGELLDPAGSRTPVSITPHDDGATAFIDALLKPGLYRLRLPDSMRDEFQELLVEDAVPVAVRPQPIESQLTVLADSDLTSATGQAPLMLAASVDDVVAQLSGQSVAGQRLWRYLAIAALLLAVAEIALARWISVQRMVGHEPVVKFASELSPAGVLASTAFERFTSSQSRQGLTPAARQS